MRNSFCHLQGEKTASLHFAWWAHKCWTPNWASKGNLEVKTFYILVWFSLKEQFLTTESLHGLNFTETNCHLVQSPHKRNQWTIRESPTEREMSPWLISRSTSFVLRNLILYVIWKISKLFLLWCLCVYVYMSFPLLFFNPTYLLVWRDNWRL